jgi:hypothetical protein
MIHHEDTKDTKCPKDNNKVLFFVPFVSFVSSW